MKKTQILEEIRRIAATNGGVPPGHRMFESETGIREHEWSGRYWARWSDALRESGLEPNQKKVAYEDAFLSEKIAALARELGRFPVESEIQLKATRDPNFPSIRPFRRLGGKGKLIAHVLKYCEERKGYEDVVAYCNAASAGIATSAKDRPISEFEIGFVYLIKSGRYYKIGRSNAAGRREREIALQLPEKAATVHTIRTDDPVGIEAYWHKRFEEKRKNGEWFDLSAQEVSIFKKRKFM